MPCLEDLLVGLFEDLGAILPLLDDDFLPCAGLGAEDVVGAPDGAKDEEGAEDGAEEGAEIGHVSVSITSTPHPMPGSVEDPPSQ